MYNTNQYQAQSFGPGFSAGHSLQLNGRLFASIKEATESLTPRLFGAAQEVCLIYGTAPAAVLANLLAAAAFVAAGSYRICDHRGNSMSLSLQVDFVGLPLNGKSDAFNRLTSPIRECMRGWPHKWLFANITPSALNRCILKGTTYGFLGMDEGMSFLKSSLSSSFDLLNNLADGVVPSFMRSEDVRSTSAMAPESIIFGTCVNTQPIFYTPWLKKHREEALGSGCLYRKLIFRSDEKAERGTQLQPERALCDYNLRVAEITAETLQRLRKMEPNKLPTLPVSPEAEQILAQAIERYCRFAQAHLSPREAEVFSIRLAANVRRIAGVMHVFENYAGAVSAETMARAVTIGEFATVCWLQEVFPYVPPPQEVLDSYPLERFLQSCGGQMGRTDLRDFAPNFGWDEDRMTDAIIALCGSGRALSIPRIVRGRRRVMIELQGTHPLLLGNL